MFKEQKINGFQLGTAHLPDLKSASVAILIPVGSRHEDGFPMGTAHFFEHMIYKGTSRYSPRALAHMIESHGCTSNAYTTEDHTLLELRGPAEHACLMLDIAADMLWDSAFKQNEIEQECQVIEEEILGYQESPSEHIFDLASKAQWGEQPLGNPITGSVESVREINRETLLNFHQAHYQNSGLIISVAGAIKHDEIAQFISSRFPNFPTAIARKLVPSTPVISHIVEHADIEQCHTCLNFPTIHSRSSQRHTLRILSLLLGETMSSHLFQTLREELGLCYSIHSDYHLYDDIGSFQIYTATDAQRSDLAYQQLQLALKTFSPSAEQVKLAKKYSIIQNQLSLEGSQPYMQWIADSIHAFGHIMKPEELNEELKQVTLQQILTLSEQLLNPQHMSSAFILPKES